MIHKDQLWLTFTAIGVFSFIGGMVYSDLNWLELLSDLSFICAPVVDSS